MDDARSHDKRSSVPPLQHITAVIHALLEDVAEQPTRIRRAQQLATGALSDAFSAIASREAIIEECKAVVRGYLENPRHGIKGLSLFYALVLKNAAPQESQLKVSDELGKVDAMPRRASSSEPAGAAYATPNAIERKVTPKDWPEDSQSENGSYFNTCTTCGGEFVGHKRRLTCKECDTRNATERTIEADRELTAALHRELLDSGLVTVAQWNDAIAPHLKKLRLRIEQQSAAASHVERSDDTERLDWLTRQGEPGMAWVARKSVTGRGYRLHQDPAAERHARENGYTFGASPREAIDAALSASAKHKDDPEPDCHKCAEGKFSNGWPWSSQKMFLCPTCGNKRCPKASDHTLACTGSNDPRQKGSVYA